jgi:DNA-binding NarL/FixJ family response regulator
MTDRPPTRIMIVDDHAVVREGIEAVLGKHADLKVVASVGGGREALAQLEAAAPDVVLLDLRMPEMDGLAVLAELRARAPRVKVIILSGQAGDEAIFRALREGAAGYLLKTARGAELTDGIRQAMLGRLRPSSEVAARLADRAFFTELTEREIEVLKHAARGESNKDIAAALGLAENTVKNHMKSIITKLQAGDRTECVTIALRRGVIDLGD